MRASANACAWRYYKVRWRTVSAPSRGPSSVCTCSSNGCTASRSVRSMFGGCWAHWAQLAEARRRAIERDEDAVRRFKRKTWPALKKVCRRATADRLRRRVGPVGAPHACAYLGAQGLHASRPVPLQLEARFGHCRPHAHELRVPAARRRDQERADRRVHQGAALAAQTQVADRAARRGAAQEPRRARVPRQHARRHADGAAARLCSRPQPGRIPVGLAQAACAGKLLSRHPGRTQAHRSPQAQERPETQSDHHRVLDWKQAELW